MSVEKTRIENVGRRVSSSVSTDNGFYVDAIKQRSPSRLLKCDSATEILQMTRLRERNVDDATDKTASSAWRVRHFHSSAQGRRDNRWTSETYPIQETQMDSRVM